MKTLLKASNRICYWFWGFSDERKHFWSIRILFDIDFKHFRMKENTFEAFEFYLLSILSVFGWTKSLFNFSDGICFWFKAFSDEWKHFLQMVFALDFERFRMDENTFEAFAFYLLSILRILDGRKHFEGFRSYLILTFSVFGMNDNTFEAFAFYLLSILSVFGWTKTLLKASYRICYWFWAFSDEQKHFWSLCILFAFSDRRTKFWRLQIVFPFDF